MDDLNITLCPKFDAILTTILKMASDAELGKVKPNHKHYWCPGVYPDIYTDNN